jgi:hypothetical protein
MNSLDCSLARFSSGIMRSPYKTPGLLSQCHPFWRIPQVPCMLGASDLVSDDDVPIPRLHVSSPQRAAATFSACFGRLACRRW